MLSASSTSISVFRTIFLVYCSKQLVTSPVPHQFILVVHPVVQQLIFVTQQMYFRNSFCYLFSYMTIGCAVCLPCQHYSHLHHSFFWCVCDNRISIYVISAVIGWYSEIHRNFITTTSKSSVYFLQSEVLRWKENLFLHIICTHQSLWT